MIERACDGEQAFDLILVHSYSRFFREAFEQEFYLRKLAKHGVRVVSITQPVGDESEPVQAMMRKVIALFDEYQSKENAKHVIRSMKENARQGFWNGATAPLGYRLVEAEKRGTKIKKKLDIDPVEAETARLIFKLYLYGDGTSGALGVKEVVKWLNRNGYRTRRGDTFGVAGVHRILTNTVYIGQWKFNKTSSRTGQRKPEEEVVTIPVPGLVEPEVFEQVQRQLHARSPQVVAPRVTTGPILLTGLAVCATCGGGMTLRTGTSQNGVIHRYYTCSTCVSKGKSACKGRSIRMDKLDGLVTGHLAPDPSSFHARDLSLNIRVPSSNHAVPLLVDLKKEVKPNAPEKICVGSNGSTARLGSESWPCSPLRLNGIVSKIRNLGIIPSLPWDHDLLQNTTITCQFQGEVHFCRLAQAIGP
jgi:site-specific DNA recombinase